MDRVTEQDRSRAELTHLIKAHLSLNYDASPLADQIKATLLQSNIGIDKVDAALTILENKGTLHKVSEALNQKEEVH